MKSCSTKAQTTALHDFKRWDILKKKNQRTLILIRFMRESRKSENSKTKVKKSGSLLDCFSCHNDLATICHLKSCFLKDKVARTD